MIDLMKLRAFREWLPAWVDVGAPVPQGLYCASAEAGVIARLCSAP